MARHPKGLEMEKPSENEEKYRKALEYLYTYSDDWEDDHAVWVREVAGEAIGKESNLTEDQRKDLGL
jgi:hypothetical protein